MTEVVAETLLHGPRLGLNRRNEQAYRQLWAKAARCCAPGSLPTGEEAIRWMAEQHPNKWRKWISEVTNESLRNEALLNKLEEDLMGRFGVSL